MAWSTQQPRESTADPVDPGLTDHLRGILASAAGYFRARLELAGLEGREAAVAYGKVFALLAVGILCLLFGYLLFWVGLVAVVAHYTGAHWGWAALAAAGLHGLGALFALLAARTYWGTPVFEETLNELRKDQQWLATPRQTARPN